MTRGRSGLQVLALGVPLLLGAVVACGDDSPSSSPPEPGAGWPVHVLAVVLALAAVGLVVMWLVRAVPPSVRPAAARAWRRDPVLLPLVVSSGFQAGCAVVMLAVPLPNGVQVPPLFLAGLVVRAAGSVVSHRRTARYGRDRRTERAELWRPGPVRS